MGDLFSGEEDSIRPDIDQKVFNPARIVKLYGTLTQKGDNTEARPHRTSSIIEAPIESRPVSLVQLRAISAAAAREDEANKRQSSRTRSYNGESGGKLDLKAYLEHYRVDVKKVKQHGSSSMYVLSHCLFNPAHAGGEASICQQDNGKLYYQCFHDSCKGQTWSDARRIISGLAIGHWQRLRMLLV